MFLEIARKADFDAVELTFDKVEPTIEGKGVDKLGRDIEEHGLVVASINGPENFNLLTKEEFSNLTKRAHDLAMAAPKIGCNLLVPVPSNVRSQKTNEVVSEAASALSNLAETCGSSIKLGLEFLGIPMCSINNLGTAAEVVREVGKPNIGLVIDSFHMHLSRTAFSEIARLPRERIFMVHVNDSEEGNVGNLTDANRLFPGQGVIDLNQFKAVLENTAYGGFLSLEVLRPDYWHQDPEKIARTGRESLRSVFGI